MATLRPLRPHPAAAEGRRAAHRVRLTSSRVYACRFCRESIQVTSARYLPDTCVACGGATWEADARCGAWDHCDAVRRPGVAASHCHACGYSVWTPVRVPMRAG